MSIRDELRERRGKTQQEIVPKEKDLDSKAESFIEEFIIPLFRTTSDLRPNESILQIKFHYNMGCWCYTTTAISWEKRVECPYKYETVSHAVKLAAKYDIEADSDDDGSGGTTLWFRLDNVPKEKDLDTKAESFIEDFIIPLFRITSDLRPNESILQIKFHYNMGCWCYTTTAISWEKRAECQYKYETVASAVKLAAKYDIEADSDDDGSGGTTLWFRLDIS